MNNLLVRLGGFAARRHWIVIIAWVIILGGALLARHVSGGEFVNNYTVSGSGSALGLDRLNQDSRSRAGTRARSCSTLRPVRSRPTRTR